MFLCLSRASWFCALTTPPARAEDELRPLGADAVVELAIDVPADQLVIVRVDQIGIDAVFDVRTNGAAEPSTEDYPTEWMTPEWLVLDSGHHDVTIRPKRQGDVPGSIRVNQVTTVPGTATDKSSVNVEALRELMAGGRACATEEWERGANTSKRLPGS